MAPASRSTSVSNETGLRTDKNIPNLLTISQMAKKHPFMSENSIRWLLFKNPPGLEECLVRVSRRVYIKEKQYFQFLQDSKLNRSEA